MTVTILSEQVDLSEARLENDVLRGVVLIRAGMSKNRKHYSESVLRQSVPHFDGAKAYNGHAPNQPVTNITGWYSNPRYDEDKKAIIADRHFAPTQAGRDVKALVAEITDGRAPATLAGLSINAVGRVKASKFADGDGQEVESISSAESVDDVSNPAAGGTYLAASADDGLTARLFAEMTYEEFLEARPDYTERLRKDFKRVRQEETLKSAEAETQRVTTELAAEQAAHTELKATHSQALNNLAEAQRDLAVEKALAGVKVPLDWRESLREQLSAADPTAWADIIEREARKAQTSGYRPRVEDARGSGQQIERPVTEGQHFNPLPRGNERIEDWVTRVTS